MRILLLLLCCSQFAFGQNETVYAVNKLPETVQLNLNNALFRYFGEVKTDLYFVDAQVIDFVKPQQLVPRYAIHYYTMGKEKYNLYVRLDQFGQLIDINKISIPATRKAAGISN